MDLEEFAQQDFLKMGDNLNKYKHVKSHLISGDPDSKPLVSIAIPTYKRAELLKEAVESCLQQNNAADFNIVITDDDPQPDNETELLILSLPQDKVLYFKNEENIGALANFNRCIENSNGAYAVMLHADDLLDENYISKVIKLLKHYPEADILIPDTDIIINNIVFKPRGYQQFLRFLSKFFTVEKLAIKLRLTDFILYNLGSPGMVYKRLSFLESEGYNSNWHPTGDKIFHLKMAWKNKLYITNLYAGKCRFINNITMQSGMLTNYIERNYYFTKYLARVLKKNWIHAYYRGYCYFSLNRKKYNRFGVKLDAARIEALFEQKLNVKDLIFFLAVWTFASVLWVLRILHAAALFPGRSRMAAKISKQG